MNKKRLKGFTLVELLIVSAVVGVLCAILFGVFTRLRQKANQASCQSNLKQISLAFQQYVQDNDSKYPKAVGWEEHIMPYVKNQQVFRCPSDTREISSTHISNYGITPDQQQVTQAPRFILAAEIICLLMVMSSGCRCQRRRSVNVMQGLFNLASGELQVSNIGPTRRCARPPTASLSSLVPLCAFGDV